ncbi:MAG: M24 family metallopeptidase [Phycisphaerae bacterium]|nr:M24 family metallopeptidase [Phycisphaerae bacterium]
MTRKTPVRPRARAPKSRNPARGANAPSIPAAEFASRRRRVLESLKGAVGAVFAGDADPHLEHGYRPHAHFEYLSGVTDEPGAIILFDPSHPQESKRITLLLKPLNPEVEKWDGFRHEIGSALRERTGFDTVVRTTLLPRLLLEGARRTKRLACLMPLSAHTAPVSPDLELFRRSAERIPGCVIEDRTPTIALMRAAKSAAEVSCIRRAGEITAAGFDAVLRSLRPGQNEFDVQRVIEQAYRDHGARTLAYRTIAGGGFNATVLHYHANDQMLGDGDCIVIDSAARWNGYSADVTRTYPVNGRFSTRQRQVYEIVLESQLAAIRACRAGRTLLDVDDAARAVIRKAGYGDFFIHGIGHHLGLETHDASPDAPLPIGAVVTIEPGIYIPQEKLGVRIEDDVLVTKTGATVLTPSISKDPDEIERRMRSR